MRVFISLKLGIKFFTTCRPIPVHIPFIVINDVVKDWSTVYIYEYQFQFVDIELVILELLELPRPLFDRH